MKKQLILFLLSAVTLSGFFFLPRNREWAGVIFSYAGDFRVQKKHMDRETRMRRRFGNDYSFSKQISDSLALTGAKDSALVLMPPSNFFTAHGLKYHVPEPAVFYYFTGLKTTWANSERAANANWMVRVVDKKIVAEPVTDRNKLKDTIAAFIKLGITL
jgi:hypothetical protein